MSSYLPKLPGVVTDSPIAKYLVPGTTETYDMAGRGDSSSTIDDIPLIGQAKKAWFDDPANEQKAAFDQAMQLNKTGTQDLVNYYAGQQDKAAANYKPLKNMFAASYGTQGIQAPQAPGATGKPLTAMYGGK